MAKLDLSKDLGGSKNIPSKKGINLAKKEETTISIKKLLPWILVILVLAAGITKFGIMDRFEKLRAAQAEAAAAASQKSLIDKSLADYTTVEAEYRRYAIDWMGSAEAAYIKRSAILQLVNEELSPAGLVLDFSSSSNGLSVSMSHLTLQQASKLVTTLSARKDVAKVTFGTATQQNGADADLIITFNITMVDPEKEGQ